MKVTPVPLADVARPRRGRRGGVFRLAVRPSGRAARGSGNARPGPVARPGIASALLLLVLAVVSALAVLEIALRVLAASGPDPGGRLEQLLERSRRAAPGDTDDPVSLRGLVRPSTNPGIVYEARPGLRGRFHGRPITINSRGMRDRELPLEKPPNTFRIAGLGDSVMFGWGVGQDETYLRVLERKLNALPPPHPRFETLNFALPGYNTAMEVAAFEAKALDFDPDLVIIQFVNNDWGVPHFMRKPVEPWARDRSFLWDFVTARLGRAAPAAEGGLLDGDLVGLEGAERAEVLEPYRPMIGADGYRRAMKRLAGLTRPRGLPLVLLRGTCSEAQRRVIDEVAAEHGIHVLDIGAWSDRVLAERGVPPTREAKRAALWVSADDHHPNALGHEIYATGLAGTLERLGVLDGTARQERGLTPRKAPVHEGKP